MKRYVRIPGRRRPITRKMIEDSIEATKSNAEASRWLGVSYNTYKKWAKYYGLFENNLNQSGKGIRKRATRYKVSLESILDGEHPDYSNKIFKKRLVNEGLLQEECSLCRWGESRLIDNKILKIKICIF